MMGFAMFTLDTPITKTSSSILCLTKDEVAANEPSAFFTGTYASAGAVSHVGIYVGGSRMLHCGSPIGYADLTSPYWNSHLYAFGRLATIPE